MSAIARRSSQRASWRNACTKNSAGKCSWTAPRWRTEKCVDCLGFPHRARDVQGRGWTALATAPILGSVVTISISAEARAAIAATLPDGREAERRPDGKGAYFVTLPRDVLDKLNYLRGPGESYSDVIIRVARG